MFEEKTFENLMNEKLKNVPSDVDKREGSIIWDSLAPNALESAMIFQEINAYYKETFGNTASRVYLIERCRERGIHPKPASAGVYKGQFDIEIPIGHRFSLELYNYKVIKYIQKNEFYEYELECETLGTDPNSNFGQLIPIGYLPQLKVSRLVETLIPGEDEEGTESLRKRYLNSFDGQAFGGNIKDYENKVLSISGVGAVKVTPVWNGGGTVKLTILDSEFDVATPNLIDKVQQTIDPTRDYMGKGLAPIGHIVTVDTPTKTTIYIATKLIIDGVGIEYYKEKIDETLKQYLYELRKQWNVSSKMVIRISQIEARILAISPNIIDIKETKINGYESNLELDSSTIPTWGDGNYVDG